MCVRFLSRMHFEFVELRFLKTEFVHPVSQAAGKTFVGWGWFEPCSSRSFWQKMQEVAFTSIHYSASQDSTLPTSGLSPEKSVQLETVFGPQGGLS